MNILNDLKSYLKFINSKGYFSKKTNLAINNLKHLENILINHQKNKDKNNNKNNNENINNSDNISKEKNIKKSKKFRFRRKNILLTYSDCDNLNYSPKNLIADIRSLEKDDRTKHNPICNNIKSIVVSKEYHESNKPHFHVFIQFFETIDTSNYKLFDIKHLKHPNWRTVYTKRTAVNYIIKHTDFNKFPNPKDNPDFAQYKFDILYYMKTAKCHKKRLAYEIINGKNDFHNSCKKYPELVWEYNKYKNNFNSFKQEEDIRNNQLSNSFFVDFNQQDIPKYDFSKPSKSGHLYIVGPSNAGKSTFLRKIRENYKSFRCPDDDDWTGYDDRLCDFMYFEEFGPHYTLSKINRILDPDPNRLRIKCFPGVNKNLYKPVIFCSNFFPHEIYKKVSKHKMNAFLQRIKIIYLDKSHKFHLLWDPEKMILEQYNFSWSIDNFSSNKVILTPEEIIQNNPNQNYINFPVPKKDYKKFFDFWNDHLLKDDSFFDKW